MGPEPRVIRHPRRTKAPAIRRGFLDYIRFGRKVFCMYTIPDWARVVPLASDKKAASAYAKALKSDTTPLSIDAENGTGEFEGKHGHYLASLEGCPCGARPKPCKHMYRIAIELGLMPGQVESDRDKVLCRQITHESNITSDDVRCQISSFDRETQLLLYRIAESCKDSSLEETATMYLRTHASDCLLRSGFVDESIGDYLNCSFSVSKDDILQSLKKSGLDAPSSLFGKSSRWAKIHSHLQSLYETHPKEISETFVVLTGTPLTKEKAHVITRYLSPILWPTDQQTLFEL